MNPVKSQRALVWLVLAGCAPSLAGNAQSKPVPSSSSMPSAVQQLVTRAKALDGQGRHDLAADNWRQVLLIDPKQPAALAALASYYQSIGDTVHAGQYLQQLRSSGAGAPAPAAPSGDGNGDSRLQQASKLAAAHHYSESLALYRQVFGSTPPAGPWAVAYYETEAAVPEELPAAITGLRSLITKYPQDPTYKLSLGKVLTYKPATRLEGVRILADLHGSASQSEQARAAWHQAILWDLSGPAAVQTGPHYLERYPDADLAARLHAESAKVVKPEAPAESPLEGEGYKALTAGDLTLAKEKFSALLSYPGATGKAHVGLGYVAMQQQDFAAAVDNFEKARVHGVQTPAIEKALLDSRYFQAMAEGNKALKASEFDAAVAAFTRARQIAPQRPEAVEALAGSLVADGQPDKAEGLFADAVKRNPENVDAWVEWFDALLAAGDAQRIVDEQAHIPTAVSRKLEQRVDYLAILSSANRALGDDAAAQRFIDRVQELNSRGGAQNSAAQLRAAGLLLQQGNTDGAAQLCRSVVQADHGNIEAWQMLIRAAHMAGDDVAAMSVAERMPESVYKTALKDPEFLMTLAAIDQSRQQYDQASKLLDRARSNGPEDLATSARFQLQLASLDLARGNPEHAFNTYRRVASEYPDQLAAWSGMLAALHEGKHDQEALLSVQRTPADIALRLQTDTAYLQVLASIYSESGHPRQALDCLRTVASLYQQRNRPAPFAVDTQFAWLLLNQGDQRQLSATLDRLGNSRDLTADQKQELENIWAAWSMRRAEAEFAAGNGHKALTILQIAYEAYPENATLRRQLSSMYVRTGNPGAAFKMYQDLDWETAKVEDYSSAIDAALVDHRVTEADKWLQDGLGRYPGNDQLLSLGARLEEQRGDVKRAKEYLLAEIENGRNAADDSMNSPRPVLPRAGEDELSSTVSPEKALADILGSSSGTSLRTGKAASRQALPSTLLTAPLPGSTVRKPQTSSPDRYAPQPPDPATQRSLRQDNFVAPSQAIRPATYSSSDLPAWPAKMSVPEPPPPPVAGDPDFAAGQLSDASARLVTTRLSDERLQPLVRLREASFSGNERGGDASDREIEVAQDSPNDPTAGDPVRSFTSSTPVPVSEADLASEQKASQQLAALESRYSPYVGGGGDLDSHTGTQGFDHLNRFEATTEASTVFGDSVRFSVVTHPILLESGVPDSTSNYRFGTGLRLPTSDQYASGYGAELQIAGKFVQGSAGYSPINFPVKNFLGSLTVQPGSGGFALRGYRENVKDTLISYAGVKDPTTGKIWGGVVATGGSLRYAHGTGISGFYASIDGQELTGRNIATNTRIDGGTGAYFQVYADSYGALKVGANLTAMHYSRNERYFTYGQGGYFSPNAFLLMNAPITWEGAPIHNFSYTINGSLGVQTFQDDKAMTGSLIVGNGAQSITGASYDFHVRAAYHLNQHWLLEAFVDANNARDYQNTAGGFSLRYLIRPLPVEGGPTGLLEERQIRPLALP